MADNQNSNRFYEGRCAPFAHEPTRDNLAIIESDSKGEGLTTLKAIQQGDVVFRFWGPTVSEQSLFTLQQAPGIYIEDPLVMGKVLHACDPNMTCDMQTLTFTATRPIKAGEYLTMDYDTTEDVLFRSFTCRCGSPNCRGPIQGRLAQGKTPAKQSHLS